MNAEELKKAQAYLDNEFSELDSRLAKSYDALRQYIYHRVTNTVLLEMQENATTKEQIAEYVYDYLTYRVSILSYEDQTKGLASKYKNSGTQHINSLIRKYKIDRSSEESYNIGRKMGRNVAVKRAVRDFETLCPYDRSTSPSDVAIILEFEVLEIIKVLTPSVKSSLRPKP